MIKILLVTNHLNPGGIPWYCLLVARHLKAKGHEAIIASGGGEWESVAKEGGIRHIRVPLHTSAEMNPGVIVSALKLKNVIKKEGIQILHDQTRVTQVLSSYLSLGSHIVRVSTCHGFFKRRLLRKWLPLWGRKVIAISDAVEAHLRMDWGLDPDRIRLIPHGVTVPESLEHCRDKRRASRAKWQLPDEAFLIGTLGRLSPVKGYDILIRAMDIIRHDPWKPHLCLVGNGPESGRLKHMVDAMGLQNQVKFIRDLTQEADKERYFGMLDAFCAPSREEGLGLSILEAMGYEKAVIASGVGGIPTLIKDGENGLLVRPGEPAALAEGLRELAVDRVKMSRMARTARQSVLQDHRVDDMIRKTVDLYEEVLGG